jgi:GTP-binding protein
LTSSRSTEGRFSVAILGRPNVGKSTLFNRLVGSRRAITDPSPGVTRDAVEGTLEFDGLTVQLLDSGGYSLSERTIEKQVAARALVLAGSSDLILLVLEQGGVTKEDLELLDRLRRYEEKLVLVVNKVDTDTHAHALGEFHALGVRRQIDVSAAHGRNVGTLKDLIRAQAALAGTRKGAGSTPAVTPAERSADRPPRPILRLAILGKPNTGKSTLLNRLLREEKSLVTDVPGTTRDPVTGSFRFKGTDFHVIDTAGIRRKSKVTDPVEYYSVNRAIKCIDEADVVILLIDVQEGVTDQDKKIAALAASKGRGIVLVQNKWDLASTDGWEPVRSRTRFLFPAVEFAPLLALSARTGGGVSGLLDTVIGVWRQLNRTVTTAQLNRHLRSWVAEHPLPVHGRNVKIRYATQTGTNPVKFVFFVSTLAGYPSRYSKYLVNRIRQDLGFASVPVSVEVRQS